jgi:hypothetical protein
VTLAELITNLSDKGDPNYKQNIKEYNAWSGLPVEGANQGYNAMRYLLPALFKLDADQLGFFAEMQPEYRDMISQIIQMVKDPSAASSAFRNKVFGEAQNSLPAEMMQLASAGGSAGSKAGLAVASTNNAKRRANEFDAQLYSPEGRMRALSGASDLIRQQMPTFSGILNAHGVTTSTPRGTSGLDAIGGLAGMGMSKWKGWG